MTASRTEIRFTPYMHDVASEPDNRVIVSGVVLSYGVTLDARGLPMPERLGGVLLTPHEECGSSDVLPAGGIQLSPVDLTSPSMSS